MGKFILLNCRLFTGGADLSGASNKMQLASELEVRPATNFLSGGWVENMGGLASAEIEGEGQWEAGDTSKVDDAVWQQLGGIGPWTICPASAAVGGLAYFTSAMTGEYKLGDQVGEVAPWNAKAGSSWPLTRGLIAHDPGTPRTATATGTAAQLGAVPAGKSLYAALHVLSASGTTPSLTVAIDSDNAVGFPSPVTPLTFNAATGRGGQIARVAGPLTDDWFRPKWTISGTAPSFLFVVAFGIA